MSEKWIVVTAGVGTELFEGAAFRVKSTIQNSGVVDKTVAIVTSDLNEICPRTSEIYSDLMNTHTRGYGYMSWKAEIVNAAFQGKWGDFDGVIWIDAGCEVTLNHLSKLYFRRFQKYAQKHGVACFTLDTPEIQYTKRDIFELFPQIDPEAAGNQIQSTWMFLHGEKGRLIASQWLETVCKGTNLLDLEPSSSNEFPSFIENRYDQSTFSMVCKLNQINVMKYRPTTGSGSVISRIRGVVNPIWAARNRTPQTIKPKFYRFLESLAR